MIIIIVIIIIVHPASSSSSDAWLGFFTAGDKEEDSRCPRSDMNVLIGGKRLLLTTLFDMMTTECTYYCSCVVCLSHVVHLARQYAHWGFSSRGCDDDDAIRNNDTHTLVYKCYTTVIQLLYNWYTTVIQLVYNWYTGLNGGGGVERSDLRTTGSFRSIDRT
jgi:hypothetical protein